MRNIGHKQYQYYRYAPYFDENGDDVDINDVGTTGAIVPPTLTNGIKFQSLVP